MTARHDRPRIAGWAMTAIVSAFMLFDAAMKIAVLDVVTQATAGLGYPATASFIRGLGLVALACTGLYAFPRTAMLGAILLTAYLGGAVASHVRIGSPLFSHVLFGVYLAVLAWGGLFLRDARLRALLPVTTRQ